MSKASDKRFFELRNSGYKGPIDQDGKRADSPDHWSAKGFKAIDKNNKKYGNK